MSNTVWQLLDDLANKKGITEVVINGPKNVFVERAGQFIQLNVALEASHIPEFCKEVAKRNGKVYDQNNPLVDGNLPDGSRINIVGGPYVQHTPAITIRKYLRSIKSFSDNVNVFGLNAMWVEFFQAMVSARFNVVVSGGTGVGKTTFMNLLLNELSNQERVITIEDTYELNFKIPNLVRLSCNKETKDGKFYTARDMVKNTLRMRPDRIIIGEVRGEELFDLLQVMNTGHEGSMTSVHANTTGECLNRMETLFLLSGYDVPYHVVRRQIASAVDYVIQLSRDREGNRVVSKISEITGVEGDRILMSDIALEENGKLRHTGLVPSEMQRLHERGGISMNFFS